MSAQDLSPIQQKLLDSIGEVFHDLRMEELLSQKEMAERMNAPQYMVSRLERGEVNLRIATLQRYADALGFKISIEFLPKE